MPLPRQAKTRKAAKDFIAAHSDPGANHNCWAWWVRAIGGGDDREPSGMAGKPILQVLIGCFSTMSLLS
ncbi:YigZ family protein [Microvirga vignae]|uniref:YigZ family protein n=1 Tax=Microvirga vignae TaxID=1225564 RepID=UPI000699F592|nr:YigZ family protein [Microvirga vignae]